MKTLDTDLLAVMTRRLVDEFQPEQIILFGSHGRVYASFAARSLSRGKPCMGKSHNR